MEKAIKKICTMLQSPDGMRRCAAAMVLAELAPQDPAVVKELGAALPMANQMLTRYIIEAFEHIGHRSVVPFVLPLLEAPDVEIKMRAAGIIGRFGGQMVGELKRQFAHASPQQKRVLVEILARIHGRESLQMILETFYDPDAELAKEACDAVRRHIEKATPADRSAMHRQVVRFVSSARAKKDERVLTNCVLLIGFIGAPDARQMLLRYAGPRNPNVIRRNALIGLKNLTYKGAAAGQVASVALRLLSESDWLNVAQHALDLIERLPLPKSFERQWAKLLQSKHAAVRSLAARRIAANDTPATNQLLMKLLHHGDSQLSEIALGALSRHKGATALLLAALSREQKSEPAWRLAKILRTHSESIDKKTRKKFAAMAARDLEAGRPRHEALLYFLRNTDPALADQALREVGLKFKKARKWHRAIECLQPLVSANSLDEELRYTLSLCQLKQSAKDLTPHLRAEDEALKGLQTLIGSRKFKLADQLKKERGLTPDDLLYIGFHFIESSDPERKFGQQILELLIRKSPRTKPGRTAREKLKLIGTAK